jgi:DNA-binding MarR family transcriptional regulator
VTTELDENDRRSWIIHLEEEGRVLAGDFRVRLRQRLEEMFGSIPGFDLEQLLQFSRATLAATSGPFAVGQTAQ